MGSSSQTTKSTQTKTPYGPATGAINTGLGQVTNYLNNPNSNAVYDGPRVADLSGDTQNAISMLNSSAGANTSADYLTNLLNTPSNVADNPQVQALQDAIRRQVQATSNSQFSNAGTVGSTFNQESLSKGLADGLAQPLFTAYQNDQANKLQAAGLLPTVSQQAINNQLTSGQIQDSYAQNKINADMQKFEDQRTAPIKAWSEVAPSLAQFGSQFGTSKGSQTTTTDPSLTSQLLGGALAAGGIASGLGGTSGLSSLFGGLFGGGNKALAPWTATVYPGQ
jgi:hypothetical protein